MKFITTLVLFILMFLFASKAASREVTEPDLKRRSMSRRGHNYSFGQRVGDSSNGTHKHPRYFSDDGDHHSPP
nr:hypothetical protein CFP56_71855 [Quercus suber]